MDSTDIIKWAFKESSKLLGTLEPRWTHVKGVVKKAHKVSKILEENERPFLIVAAYLHDIGYSPIINKTGFHPLDGAVYLQAQKQTRLASLVAYHSGAVFEAHLKGLANDLNQFVQEYSSTADALTYCDMTVNSKGEDVTFKERLDDIFSRYDENHIVNKAIHRAEPTLSLAINHIEELIDKNGLT